MCKRKDIPYWQILLGLDAVLEINGIEIDENNVYDYSYYSEYVYEKSISASDIKRVYLKTNKTKAMHDLCLSYLDSLSIFTVDCARYYYHKDKDYDLIQYEDLECMADCIIAVMRNLDYSVCTKKEIKNHLKEEGEAGAYTFCDMYFDTGTKLYQQLILYPEDGLSEKRKQIYCYFKKYLKGCFDVNTGGWCG